jgi:hypothetical protein
MYTKVFGYYIIRGREPRRRYQPLRSPKYCTRLLTKTILVGFKAMNIDLLKSLAKDSKSGPLVIYTKMNKEGIGLPNARGGRVGICNGTFLNLGSLGRARRELSNKKDNTSRR